MIAIFIRFNNFVFLALFLGVLPNIALAEKTACDVSAKIVMDGVWKNNLTISQFMNAKKICSKLAAEGDPEAQYHLGGLDTVHIGNIYPNESEMWKWMKISAENGYAKAQSFLGRSYETDKNFHHKKDINLAIKWHILAAEQHDIASMVRLEEVYRKGLLGIHKNIKKADYWANELRNIK